MRKFFAKLHLWLSVPVGILISVICLSGALLVFEQEITRVLRPGIYWVEVPAGAQPLQPSLLAERIREQVPDSLHLASLQIPGDRRSAWMAGFKETGRRMLSVNPYTGEVSGWAETPGFFQTMRKLHRWMMDPPASKGRKSVGKVVVGVSTLVMVVILVSGLVIWVPRSRKGLRSRLKVSCRNGWRRFWYDSHVVLGFYATLLLLVMALTGLTWSFGWYRSAAYALFGGGTQQASAQVTAHAGRADDTKDVEAQGRNKDRGEHRNSGSRDGNGRRSGRRGFDYAVWDNVLQELRVQYPVFKTVTLGDKNAQIAPDPDSYLRRTDKAAFDPRDGRITELSRYQATPRAQSLRGWFYAFHTGTWGGILVKVLYFLAALIGGILPLTGYYLWFKRTKNRRKVKYVS